MAEKTLEQLFATIEGLEGKLNDYVASTKKADHENEDKEKEAAKLAKSAAKLAALKAAMDEEDEEKRDAAIRKAMDMEDEKKDAKKATDEDVEKEAQIAAILNDKKTDYINKILTANKIFNPQGIKAVEERIKVASITDLQKEWTILAPAFEGATAPVKSQEKIIPFFANIQAGQIDKDQLDASSPESSFAKLSSKELLEMYQ